MDFILLSVYILTNLCFSLGGMTPKTIIIASETSRWIHQSGTPPLTGYHASKQVSSHTRASPYMTMTSVPVPTSITSSETSSISTTTSTSVNQPIVPSRSTPYHQASAEKAISRRYSVHHTDSRTKHPVIRHSASDSSTRTSSMHLSDSAQTELLLQSSMVDGYDSDTHSTSRGTSTGAVNTQTVDNYFMDKSLETVSDSLSFNNHQTQRPTSSISTFDILRDSNFTASQIADWFESVVSMSTSKSNTTSASSNSSETDSVEAQSDPEIHHTSIDSTGSDQISETPLSLSTTPSSSRNTLHYTGSSKYSSRVKKTDSITYSSASDFLVTYSLINVFKAQKEDTQTSKVSYFANHTSLLGVTSLPKTSRDESVSETSDLLINEETSVSQGPPSSLQSTISTSASPSTHNKNYMNTPSLQSHLMSEPRSRLFSTKLYENPVGIRAHKTTISELKDTDNNLSIVESENGGSAFSSRRGRNTLPITSGSVWFTDVTRTRISEIISVSEIAYDDVPNTGADLHSSIQPEKHDRLSGTTHLHMLSLGEASSLPLYKDAPVHSAAKFDNTVPPLSTVLTTPSVSPGLLSDITHKVSSSTAPFVLFSQEEAFVTSRSEGVIVTDSRKQAFSQTNEMASYSSYMSFSDIKPSASKKASTSTLLISDKQSSATDVSRLLSNHPIGDNSLGIHTVTYSSDQSLKVSGVDLVIDPSYQPSSDIKVTASDGESFSSLESIEASVEATDDVTTSSSSLPNDVNTASARTLKSYSSDLPVSEVAVLSTQRHASTPMDVHSSELPSKSNAEPFLQFPSISINIKTKHSRKKGASNNIHKASSTALSTAQEHSTVFLRKESSPDTALAPTRTSMSAFESLSSKDKLFTDSHTDATGYIESSSTATNHRDYSMADVVVDTLYSSQAESKFSTRANLYSEIKVPYSATISYTTIRGNGSTLGGDSSSFPISSPFEDNASQTVQNTELGEIPDVYSSMVDSSLNQKLQLDMTVYQTSTLPDISEILKHTDTWYGDSDSTVNEVYRLTSNVLYELHPSSTYRHTDQSESSEFQWEGRKGESTEYIEPYIGEKSHIVSTSSTTLNSGPSKTTSYTQYRAYLPISTDTTVSSSTMDQIMEHSLILRVKQVADDTIVSQDDSASLGSSTYGSKLIGSKTSHQMQSSSVLLLDQTKHRTAHIASSITSVLHTSSVLEQIAPSSQIKHSGSVVSWVVDGSSPTGSDAVTILGSSANRVESGVVYSSTVRKDGETFQATLSSTDISHYSTSKPTQVIRQTPLLSEMPSKQLPSTLVRSLLKPTSIPVTSSSSPHPTLHTQGSEREAQESDFILKWVFDPKGEDITSAEFLAKVVKGLELSYEIGLKSQVNVRLRRDTASTSNVDVQIMSTKPRPDGSIEMEFTVTRNGQKILARDAEATFNKISLEELNRNTGVTSLGMMGLTSLQQEQVVVNDLLGEEPQQKEDSNNRPTNGIQLSDTPAGDTIAIETNDSHGDVSSLSNTTFGLPTATFVTSDIASLTTTDTKVSDHVMTSIDNSYASSDFSRDVVIEMVIISNQQEPGISKEMHSASSPDIYKGSQQRSIPSRSSSSTHIRPSVTVSESPLMSEESTYPSVFEQVRTSQESELRPSSGETSSFNHDRQATVFKPVVTEKLTIFPNAAAAWDNKLITTFYDEMPLYIDSSLSEIDVTKSTANELVYKSMLQSSSELFVKSSTNEPRLFSYTASVGSYYKPSFLSSPSITEFTRETPLMSSINGVTLKPFIYVSSPVSVSQTYPFSLASKNSDITSPSDMVDDFSSFSADMDSLASTPSTASMPFSVEFSTKVIPTESQEDSLSSSMPPDYGFDTIFGASENKVDMFVSRTSSPISSTYEPSASLLNITSFPPANRSSATKTKIPSPSNARMELDAASASRSMFEDVSNGDLLNSGISSPISDLFPKYDASNDVISVHSTGLDMNPTSGAFTNLWVPRSETIDSNLYSTDSIHFTETMLPSTQLIISSILSPESKDSLMISSMYIDAAPSAPVTVSKSHESVSLPRETLSTLRISSDASSPNTAPTPVEAAFSSTVTDTNGFVHSSISPSPDLKTSVSSKASLLSQSTSSSPISPPSLHKISTADVSEPPPTMFSGDMDSSQHITSSVSFTNVPMTSSGSAPTVYARNDRYSFSQRFPSMTSTLSSSRVLNVTRSTTNIPSIESSPVSVLSSTEPVVSASGWTVLSVSSSPLPNTERFSSLSVLSPSIVASSTLSTKSLSTDELTSYEKPTSLPALPLSTDKTVSKSMSRPMSLSTEESSSLSTRSQSMEGLSSLFPSSLSTEGFSSLSTRSLSSEGSSSLSTRSQSMEGLSSLFPSSLSTEGFSSLSTRSLSSEGSSSLSTRSQSMEGLSSLFPSSLSTEGFSFLSTRSLSSEGSSSLSTRSQYMEGLSSLFPSSLSTEGFSFLSTRSLSSEGSSSLSTRSQSREGLSSLFPSSLSSEGSSSLSTRSQYMEGLSSLFPSSLSTEGFSSVSTRSLSSEGSSSLSTRSQSREGLSSLLPRSLSTEGFSSLPTKSLHIESLSTLIPRSPSTEWLLSLSSKTSPTEESSTSSFLISSEGSVFSSPIPFASKGSSSSTTVLLSTTGPLLFEHSSSESTILDVYSSYPTATVYSNELTRFDPLTSSRPSVLPPVLDIASSLSSSPEEPSVSTTSLPFHPSFSAESLATATRTIPINQSSSGVSPVSATTTGPIHQSSSGQTLTSATITGPIKQSSSRESLASATTLPIIPSTSGEYLTSVTSVPINQSSSFLATTLPVNPSTSGKYLASVTTTTPINPSSGEHSTPTTTTLFINSSTQDKSLAPTATLPIKPSSTSRTPATGLKSSSVPSSTSVAIPQSTTSAMPASFQSPGPESSTIPSTHPDSSPPPSTTVPASDGPPADTLMLLIMNIGLDVNITSAQFSHQLEKDLAELYTTALKQRTRRDITQRLARHRRQSGVNAEVVSNERDPGDDFKVTTTFAVSDGGDFVPADVAVPVYNRISQEQISSALAHSVIGPITAAQTSSKPQLEDRSDNSYILILCIVIPAALLVLAILFLVTRMRRRRRANAVGDLPPRYQRGDTLEDHNLTVDVEKGEIVDKTPASTPSLSPRSNSSTAKKVPLLGGVCVLPGVGDGDGLRRQDSDKYRELTETDYHEQVLLADQEKDSHRSLILREKELLEKLGVHENQKEVDSCDEQTLELPRRTRSKKGKGKAASSQFNTVGSECPLIPSSGSMTTVSSIDSGDHTDASDEFTVIIPKTKSPKIEAKVQKESTSSNVPASDDAVLSVPIVSEAQLTSVAVQASAAEQVNVCPEMRSVDTQTSKDASLTSDTDSSPDEKGETSKMRGEQGYRPETESKQVQTPWVRKISHTHDIFIDDDDLSYPNSPVNTRLSVSAGPGETSKFIFPETDNTVYQQTVHKREEEAKRAKAQQLMVEVVQQRKNLTEHTYSQAEQDLNSPSISSLESDSDLTINSDQLSLEDDSLEDAILALGPLQIAQQSEMTTTWSRKSSGVTYVGSESGESSKEYRDIYPAQGCVGGTDSVPDSPQPKPRTSGHKYPHDSSTKHSLAAQIEQEAIFEEEEALRKTEETTRRAQQLLDQTHALGFAIGVSQSGLMERVREEVKNSEASVPDSKPPRSTTTKTPVPKPRKDHSRDSSNKRKQVSSEPSGSSDHQGASNTSRAAPKSSKGRSSDSTAALLERVRGELQRLDSQQSDSDCEVPDDVPSQHQTRRL